MSVELIFGSKSKVKVLRHLVRVGEDNITSVARATGLNTVIVNRVIDDLKKAGVVEEKRFGRIRILKLVRSPVGEAVANIFKVVEGVRAGR